MTIAHSKRKCRAWSRRGVIAVVILMVTSSTASAQQTVRVLPGSVVCQACRVDLSTIVTLGDADGPGALIGEPRFLLRLRDGRFVTAEYPTASRLLVFRPDGSFDREIGRSGEGPGEFRHISTAYVTADGTLRVFDGALRRESEFDAELNFKSSTVYATLGAANVVMASNGEVYYNANVATPDAVGLPLHLVQDGQVIRSFGSEHPVHRPDAPEIGQRAMSPTNEGIWTARRTHYLIEFWTREGSRLSALERRVPWFEPYLMREPLSPSRPPESWVADLRADESGRLTVLLTVASQEFAKGLKVIGQRGNQVLYDIEECATVFDTIVEVIDTARQRVYAASRRPECLLGFVDADIYGYSMDRGFPQINVYSMRVAGN
jgi:hypothetical protein